MAKVLREMFGLDEAGSNLVIHAFKNEDVLITVESRELEGAHEWIRQNGLDGVAEYIGSFSTISMQVYSGPSPKRGMA